MELQAREEKLLVWLQKNLGGMVERCERQGRWRPAWYVDIRRDGGLMPLRPTGHPGHSGKYTTPGQGGAGWSQSCSVGLP